MSDNKTLTPEAIERLHAALQLTHINEEECETILALLAERDALLKVAEAASELMLRSGFVTTSDVKPIHPDDPGAVDVWYSAENATREALDAWKSTRTRAE
jgi:hypothetical protein